MSTNRVKTRIRVRNITTWAFVTITLITTVVLIAIALLNPLSAQYTMNHRLSYVLLSLAGAVAYILALFSTQNQTIRGWSILVIELYLFGILFQLFALITKPA